jgi:hypothetical protein
MASVSGNLDKLRTWRENNDRKSREIVEIWIRNLALNIQKFGKESRLTFYMLTLS